MKRAAAGLVTIALMGWLLWSGLRRPEAEPAREPTDRPERVEEAPRMGSGADARVSALLESAAQGDVAGYLAAFGGPARERLDREVAERGRAAFAADLRRAAEARKSHAVFAAEPDGPGLARVTVETVYPDRNERQTYRLEEQPAAGWLVTEVEALRDHQPKAKYGAPANYQEPEAVPVPVRVEQ